MVEVQEVTALQTGILEWNQPERQAYQAGASLSLSMVVSNPTAVVREYQLYLGLYDPDTGQLIEGTGGLILVDEKETFSVAAGGYVELQGSLTLDYTNVILAISLYDVAEGALASQVATLLEGESSMWEGIMPLMGGVLAIGMMGAMIPMTTKMFKKGK